MTNSDKKRYGTPVQTHLLLELYTGTIWIVTLAVCTVLVGSLSVADLENFGGGGFEAQNLKNSDVFTKIESDFLAEVGNSTVFFAQIQVVSKKKKKRSSPKLRVIFRPISEIQTFFSPKFRWSPKKKKKKVFTKIETDFSPESLRLGRWGGMHPEMEPNYSKQRLIFRPKLLLLGWWGGMHPPHPPPKSATAPYIHCVSTD